MKSYSQFLSEADNQIALLSTELLYTIVLDEANSEEVIIEALNELYIRDELSEEILNELNGVAGEPPLIKSPAQLTGPKSTALTTPKSSSVATKSASNIKDVAGKTLRSAPRALSGPASTASRLGPQAAALGVGLGAGYAAKKALNTVGPGATSKTNNISKANVKSPSNTGLSFKGDLPTMPKTSDNTKGMALTGKTFDPIKTALRGADTQSQPQVNKRMIGPMPGTKADSQKQVLSKSTPSKTVTRSATSTAAKPIDTSAKSSPKPVTSKSTAPVIPKTKTAEAPKPTKSIPKVARSAEKDPNIGRGFVTAGVSKGPSGNLRTVNLSRGKADTTSMPSKISSTKEPLQKARNQSYSKASDWKSPASGQKLAPQGSAQRDSQIAKMGYKKF